MPGCKFPGARVYELVMELKDRTAQIHSGLYQEHEFQGQPSRVHKTSVGFVVFSSKGIL